MSDALFSQLAVEVERTLTSAEPAHDYSHVQRVVTTARKLAIHEDADLVTCETAALLHELVNLPKMHPDSARSGDFCAEAAESLLKRLGAASQLTESVGRCIRVHAYSSGRAAETLEAQILQDADRLDAIGAIGIARCFATCASMGRPLYSSEDPFCDERTPNDKLWGLDHFQTKLLRIPERLHTTEARRIAAGRIEFLRAYLAQLREELKAE